MLRYRWWHGASSRPRCPPPVDPPSPVGMPPCVHRATTSCKARRFTVVITPCSRPQHTTTQPLRAWSVRHAAGGVAPPASCWRCAGGDHQWAVRAADGERRSALLLSDVPHRRSSSCSHTPYRHLRRHARRIQYIHASGERTEVRRTSVVQEEWGVTRFKHTDTQYGQLASSHGEQQGRAQDRLVAESGGLGCWLRYLTALLLE